MRNTIVTATPCSPPAAALGEGPVWDGSHVLWVDILAGAVHQAKVRGGAAPDLAWCATTPFAPPVSAVIPTAAGGLLLAAGDVVLELDADGREAEVAALSFPDDGVRRRTNDAKVDPRGRLLLGTMARDGTSGAGSLYRLDPDFRLTELVEGVSISNGLGWSPDGATLYYADTPTQEVVAFDYDVETGELGRSRPFHVFDDGLPDGLAVDRDGRVWIALWGTGQVRAFDPAGDHVATVNVGPSQVTSCAFAGPDLDILVITTAALDQAADEPDAGKIFTAVPGVAGLPVPTFGANAC